LNRFVVPLLGALGLGVIGIGAWRIGAASQAPSPRDPSDAEIAALKQELQELRQSMRRAQKHASAPVPPDEFARPASSATEFPAPRDSSEPSILAPEEFQETMEARREQNAKQRRERRERLDGALTAELRDPRWAADATKTVEGWLDAPELAGFSLAELDCKSSMCRARLAFPEDKKLEDFVVATQTKMGPFQTTSLHVVENESGQQELVAYFGRQGQALPQ
jgi:hypothetical protein